MHLSDALALIVDDTARKVRLGRRSAATLDQYQQLARYLLEWFKDLPLSELEGINGYGHISSYMTAMEETLTGHTITKRLNFLRLALREARNKGGLHELPPFPTVDGGYVPRKLWLHRTEYTLIRDQLPLHRRLWTDVCLWTAEHSSDVSALEWTHIQERQLEPGTAPVLAFLRHNTKNAATPLWCKVPRPLREILASHPGPRTGKVVGVWSSVSRDLASAARRAGVDKEPCPLDLRRTLVTWWREKGKDKQIIKEYLGHTQGSRMVDEVYTRVTPRAMCEAVDAFEDW